MGRAGRASVQLGDRVPTRSRKHILSVPLPPHLRYHYKTKQQAVFEGWLVKKSHTGMRANWKRRYVVPTREEGGLNAANSTLRCRSSYPPLVNLLPG